MGELVWGLEAGFGGSRWLCNVPFQWEHLGQLIKPNQHASSQAVGWNGVYFLLISTRNKEP